MRGRRLSAEEQAIWARVARSARPFPGRAPVAADDLPQTMEVAFPLPKKPVRRQVLEGRRIGSPPLSKAPAQDTLDGSWDKRILKGDLRPDVSIDLHGETLASAHARLNRGLDAAIRRGDRVILLVTGKAAVDNPRLPPTSRGVIRASITDWLAASSYADRIAAIRNAHPRHGGAGALYLVLRKPR